MDRKIVGNERDVLVGADEDGYIADGNTLLPKHLDGVNQLAHGLLLVVVRGQQSDVDHSDGFTL